MTKLYILNGPNMGESFELRDGYTYLGRSAKNDIQIEDKTVSRRHLRIGKRAGKYLVTDLKSRNGTFYNGKYILSPFELEIKEGVPIAIGMTLICIGEGCVERIIPYFDSLELTKDTGEQSGIFEVHKHRTNQRKLELLYSVTDTLSEGLPLNKALTRILSHMLDLLGRVDTGAFILVDPETRAFGDVIAASLKPMADSPIAYCSDLVRRVIDERKPVAISNVQAEESELIGTLKIQRIQSVMCLPLLNGSDIMGAVYFDSVGKRYEFSQQDVSFFADLSQQIAAAIQSNRFESDLTVIAGKLSADS
ncbi:MAG: FHA domain-containing protein [Deltaproteobacteria bacterium]